MEEIRTKFLIIGAGPVGLFFAIKLLENRCAKPNEIMILEAREQFTREQILIVNNETLNSLPKELKNFIFDRNQSPGCYTLPPLFNNKAECYKKQNQEGFPTSASITTKVLQEYFLTYLLDKAPYNQGIKIFFGAKNLKKVAVSNTLTFETREGKEYQLTYSFIIGAEGTTSFVRDIIMKNVPRLQGLERPNNQRRREASGLIILLKDKSGKKNYIKEKINNKTKTNFINKANRQPQHWKRLFRNKDNNIYLGLQIDDRIKRYLNHQNLNELLSKAPNLRNLKYLIDRAEYITDPPNSNREGNLSLPDILSIISNAIVGALMSADLNPEDIYIKSITPLEIVPHMVVSMQGVENINRNAFIIGDSLYGTNFFSGSGVNVGILYANRIANFLCEWKDKYASNRSNYNKKWEELYTEIIKDITPRFNALTNFSSSSNVIGRVL